MATGNVELWLGKLLEASRQAVHGVVRNAAIAVDDPSFQLLEFLNSFPAQVMAVIYMMCIQSNLCFEHCTCR